MANPIARIDERSFAVLTIGWGADLVSRLMQPVAALNGQAFSHLVHPAVSASSWPQLPVPDNVSFFLEGPDWVLPEADEALLASLEIDSLPTIHNMILGDRVVSKLPYDEVLRYATFLARRIERQLLAEKPDVVIVGFDALHGSIAMAVAKKMGIAVFAMNFSVIPPGHVAFCDGMTPGSQVRFEGASLADRREVAEAALLAFESRESKAHAYIAPPLKSLVASIAAKAKQVFATPDAHRSKSEQTFLRFVESAASRGSWRAYKRRRQIRHARAAIASTAMHSRPIDHPFVLFGFHMQPESSIDVWAPNFANQMWVVEQLARSIPVSHTLLVKIHKSDLVSYQQEQLDRLLSLPGVELVDPFADTRAFIERCSLLVAIQGTMALEAALMGKPVIVLGDSPTVAFPNVTRAGVLWELPALMRMKLTEKPPTRADVVEAFAEFLLPYSPASLNDWTRPFSAEDHDRYAQLFLALAAHVRSADVPVRIGDRLA